MGYTYEYKEADKRFTSQKRREHEKMKIKQQHIKKIIAYKGEYTAMREARHHAAYYTKGLRGGAKFRAEMGKLESFEQLEEIIFRILKENA